jgi:class 3 adenylate cyclase
MIETRHLICNELKGIGLPEVNYRVSADYGSVVLMKPSNSTTSDMIGPAVNICSKINHSAAVNGFVIGGDLHERVKAVNEYHFKHVCDFAIGLKHQYPIYSVNRKING